MRIIKRYRILISALSIAGLLLGAAGGFCKSSIDGSASAEAEMTVVEPTGTLNYAELLPFVNAVANNVAIDFASSDSSLTVDMDLASRSISFVATAPTPDEAISLANECASKSADAASEALSDLSRNYQTDKPAGTDSQADGWAYPFPSDFDPSKKAEALSSVLFSVRDANPRLSESPGPRAMKFALAGLFLGLLVSLTFAVAKVCYLGLITGSDSLERLFPRIPVLGKTRDPQLGERLWLNLCFVCERPPKTICLIPVGKNDLSGIASSVGEAALLAKSGNDADDHVLHVTGCKSLAENIHVVEDAAVADATLLCIAPWKDTQRQVDSAFAELKIAKARVVGFCILDR